LERPDGYLNEILSDGSALLAAPDFPWQEVRRHLPHKNEELNTCSEVMNKLQKMLDFISEGIAKRDDVVRQYSYLWIQGPGKYALLRESDSPVSPVKIIEVETHAEITIEPEYIRQAVIYYMASHKIFISKKLPKAHSLENPINKLLKILLGRFHN
jgi:hypothetical protein